MSKLVHIQLLRALAALSVAFWHAQHDAAALAARTGHPFAVLDRFPWMAGVDVFFVISGFIMVHASASLFGKPGARGVFLARRVARIVPLYWIVTTLYLVVALRVPALLNSGLVAPWQVAASYLFFPFGRPDGTVQPLYTLGWTLNYEMFFYGLFALVLVWPRRLALGLLVGLLAGLVVAGHLIRLQQPLAFWTDPIVLEFAFGLGIGWLRADGVVLSHPWRWSLVAAGLAVLAMNLIGLTGNLNAMRPLAWGLPAACLVAAAALGAERPEAESRLARFGALAGDISYAIYLVHPFAIRATAELVRRAGIDALLGPWGFMAVALPVAFAAGWLTHVLVERPATAFLRTRLEPVRMRVAAQARS